MSIATEIKDSFRFGSSLTKLIYINLGVFILYNLVRVLLFFGGHPVGSTYAYLLAVPANLDSLLVRPWTLITYMFFHEEFLHILFNLLWLYWFGQIFLQYLSQRQLVGVYILGGIAGALMFILFYNFFTVFRASTVIALALGASASVLAIVIAISTLRPNYTVSLLFIGPVKLKYLALFTVILDLISIPVSNAGGHIAHLGGALFGYLYIRSIRGGVDLTRPVSWLLNLFDFKRQPRSRLKVNYRKPETDYEYNARRANRSARLDEVLDKIARSGYDSLTKEEKDLLFRMKDDSIN
jgi:membrane associated rhomboid family serine protease